MFSPPMVDSKAMYREAPKQCEGQQLNRPAGERMGPPSSSSALPPQFDKPPLTARIHDLIADGR